MQDAAGFFSHVFSRDAVLKLLPFNLYTKCLKNMVREPSKLRKCSTF